MSRALVVLSMDLMWTLAMEVVAELACLIGLKLSKVDRILLAIDCRVRRRVPRPFSVASISTALLPEEHDQPSSQCPKRMYAH